MTKYLIESKAVPEMFVAAVLHDEAIYSPRQHAIEFNTWTEAELFAMENGLFNYKITLVKGETPVNEGGLIPNHLDFDEVYNRDIGGEG